MRGKTTVNTAADGTSITTISICAAVYADAAPTAIHLYAATCADVYGLRVKKCVRNRGFSRIDL